MAENAERTMMRQTEAAKRLVAGLFDQGLAEDIQLVADSIEGETSLLEAMEAAMDEIDECDVIEIGLVEKIKAFDARKKQIGDRRDRLRALIEQAMVATDQKSLKLKTATLALASRPPQLVVSNDADIPGRFWVEQERPAPKLDKKALAAALKENEQIPGAALDNGTVSLTVRRR
jgi:hypothetical protein